MSVLISGSKFLLGYHLSGTGRARAGVRAGQDVLHTGVVCERRHR